MFEKLIASTSVGSVLLEWIEILSLLIEVLAVLFILFAVVSSLGVYVYTRFTGVAEDERYRNFRHRLARSLLLGLEMLIAADIVRTVALEATLESILVLGLLVMVRTFLSWSLVIEIDGYFPWQAADKHPREDRI